MGLLLRRRLLDVIAHRPGLERSGDCLELDEGSGEVLADLSGDDLRRRQVVEVLDASRRSPRNQNGG
jgi:hypothetical protein